MLRLIYCALTLGVLSMAGCRSGRPVVGTSDACAAVPVIPVAPDSDMLSAAIADTENEVPETDLALVEKLRQGFAWQYPAAALAQVPAKVRLIHLIQIQS